MLELTKSTDYLHKEYPKKFARNEFWKQIKRTVNGEPVSKEQIAMIVNQVVQLLQFESDDILLDLGCGNGALADEFFSRIESYLGVDFSEYLLEVAKDYFQPHPKIQYCHADIRDSHKYLGLAKNSTKVLVYGCVSYLTKEEVGTLLQQLISYCPNVKKILIGNIPDSQHAVEFFAARNIKNFRLDDPHSPIGVWWTPSEIYAMSEQMGMQASCHHMPPDFYGGDYRFDLLIRRN